MALLFVEGFDSLATADLDESFTSASGPPTVGSTYKRNGANGVQLVYGTSLNLTLTPTTTASGVTGMALYRVDSSASSFFDLRNGAGRHLYLRIESDATLALYAETNALLAQSSATISSTQWHYLECKWTIADSGSFQAYLDGGTSPIINFSGDTKYQTAATWTEIRWGIIAGAELYLDDLYVCDQTAATYGPSNDDILGDVRVVEVIASSGDGTNAQFTPSTGTDNGAMVDESTPDGVTTYNASSTAGHIDTYNFPALSVTGTVLGVQLSLYCAKSDSGTRTLAAVARPASTNKIGTEQTPTTSFRYYHQVWDYSPETDTDWTVAEIDGAEFGIKVVT